MLYNIRIMAESLLLRMQTPDDVSQHYIRNGAPTVHVVTGLELADGSNLVASCHDPSRPEVTMALDWDEATAERVAEYYDRYLTASSASDGRWNCHNFVTEVKGWDVQWSDNAYPCYLPYKRRSVEPDQVQDQEAYAISGRLTMSRHSMLGLPDAQNLSVWGYGSNLVVASNTTTAEHYKGKIYPYKTPVQLGRVASWIVGADPTMPLKLPLRVRNMPEAAIKEADIGHELIRLCT